MPRKSFAALAMPTLIRPEPTRLPVPAHLQPDEAAEWHLIVAAVPADFFHPEVGHALERVCVGRVRCRRLEALIADADPDADLDRYERLVKLARCEAGAVAAAERSLRITNQSRWHKATAGSRTAGAQPPDPSPEQIRAYVQQVKATR